jgi:hypothetical protein
MVKMFKIKEKLEIIKSAFRIVYSEKKFILLTLIITSLIFLIMSLLVYIEYFFSDLFLKIDFLMQIKILLALIRHVLFSNMPLTLITNFIISLFFSVNLVFIYYKYLVNKKISKESGIMGSIGAILGLLAGGCSSCSLSILSIIGASSIVYLLPFEGNELTAIGMILLIVSIYFASRSIVGICKIK